MTAAARPRAPEDRGDPLDMSVAEAARILGISRTLAYDLVASGALPSFPHGRPDPGSQTGRGAPHGGS
jgi:excisionase family DNA binding protein